MMFFFRTLTLFIFSAKSIKQYKISICQNIKLKKSNKVLKKKIQTLKESLSQANKTDELSTIKRLRKEVAYLTKDFRKFIESSNTLTMFLKFHHPMISLASLA